MNTPTVWCVGPHQYRIALLSAMGDYPSIIIVEYNLYGVNGRTVRPRPDAPNEHGWKVSRHTFPATSQGRRDAVLHADKLLRPQDKEND